jgi:hypothetical protein
MYFGSFLGRPLELEESLLNVNKIDVKIGIGEFRFRGSPSAGEEPRLVPARW